MEIVERRDAATLLPIIEKVVRPGTTIHSDQWRAYGQIAENRDYNHRTVNHTLHFVDPKTGVHTQNIESYWAKHKQRIKTMKGCRRKSLEGYLQEFMWMEKNKNQTVINFMKLLKHKHNK